jgi:AcrR family transcriptional regulator
MDNGNLDDRKLPRREREKLAQRQDILAAALELFSHKGYRNVSVCEIAQKAEFAIGTLYKFFENKEDLYRVLLLEEAARLFAAVTKAIEEPEEEIEKIRNFVKAKWQIFRANVATIRLYFSETQGARQSVLVGFQSEIRQMHEGFLRRLAAVFERGMKRRRFRRIADPYHLAVALEGLTNAFLFLWLEDPERLPPLEEPDTILNILFKALVP